MNVLIINAFGDDPKGNRKFEEFVILIKKFFKACCDNSGADFPIINLRNYNDIDEFIYCTENLTGGGGKSNINHKRNFEKLDFIFIDGCEKYLPWKKAGAKFQTLLRMCKNSNKMVFAAGVGLQILIYFLATNFHSDINIINSSGEVESIEEINSIPKSFLDNLKKNDYFLDYVTGDLYEYHSYSKDWAPIMNVGLHKLRVAEKYMYRGKYVMNSAKYRPKSVSSKADELVTSINTEVKTYILKQYQSHWAVKDLPTEFVANSSLSWFSHNFSFKSKDLQYKILGESNKGPMMVEHGNSIATTFHIYKKYPESVKFLENFIIKKFNEVQEKGFAMDRVGGDQLVNFNNLTPQNNVIHTTSGNLGFNLPTDCPDTGQVEIFLRKTKTELNQAQQNYMYENLKNKNSPRAYSSRSPGRNSIIKSLVRPTSSYLVDTSRPFSNTKRAKQVGGHVGFGFSKRDMIFVDNNAVNARPVSSNKISTNLPINRPGSPFTTKNSFAFYVSNYSNEKASGFVPFSHRDHRDSNGNVFGNQSNIYYNGNIQQMKLIGTPYKNNRIAKLLEINDKAIGDPTYNENGSPKRQFNTIDELKKFVDENDVRDEEFMNFVNKEKVDDDKIIEFYKRKRRQITGNLVELSKKYDDSVNKLSDVKIHNNAKGVAFRTGSGMSKWKSSRVGSGTDRKIIERPASSSNLNLLTSNSQEEMVNRSPVRRSQVDSDAANTFAMMFPYVRQEEFPKPIQRHILHTGFEQEKEGKDVVRVDLLKKSTNNFIAKFKQYEKDLNNFASKPSVRCSSPYLTEEERKRKELMETKNKWMGKTDFKRVFGKHTTNLKIIPSIIATGSPPRSPSQTQFRDVDRAKWITNKNFRL